MRTSNLLAVMVIPLALQMAPMTAHAARPDTGYPDRPVRFVIGSAPGSGPDIIARVLSERLYKSWNQRSRAELDAFRRSESKRMGDIVKTANLEVK